MRLRRHQSRRALLWGLSVFVVVQFSAILLVTQWMPWLREPDYIGQVERLETLQARMPRRTLTVVALGSSRTQNDLQGSEAEAVLERSLGQPVTVCNFGRAGAGPFTELLTLRRLLADGHRPDFLLVEVLPAQLHIDHPLVDAGELYLPTVTARRSELGLLASYGKKRVGGALDWWLQWLSPLHTYRKKFVPKWLDPSPRIAPLGVDAWGWFPLWPQNYPGMFANAVKATERQYAADLHHLEPGGAPIELLTMLLEVCRRERIPTALLLMPEGATFRGWYGPGKLEQFRAFLYGLGHRFDVPVIDALEWIDNDVIYLDGHHLVVEGAQAFTRRLAGESLAPLLRHYPGPQSGLRFANGTQDGKGAQ